MTASDVGTALQIVGGLIEAGAIIKVARDARRTLRVHHEEAFEDRMDSELDVISRGVAEGTESAQWALMGYLGKRVDSLAELVEVLSGAPVRAFIFGVVLTVVGAGIAAWV